MSTLIEVCFTKCQKLIQAFITEAPLCSAIYTKHICTQTKDLFRAVTSSSEELFQCMQSGRKIRIISRRKNRACAQQSSKFIKNAQNLAPKQAVCAIRPQSSMGAQFTNCARNVNSPSVMGKFSI